jgi:hypothetical protein
MNGLCVFAVWMLSVTIPLEGAPATPAASTPAATAAVAPGTQAAPAAPAIPVRVKLDVNSRVPQVKDFVSNAMTQQLRAIPGLQLDDTNPQWTVRIETVVVMAEDGQNIACIGLSEVVLEHHPYVKMLQTLAHAWNYLLSTGILKQDQQLDQGLRQLATAMEKVPPITDSTSLSAHKMVIVSVDKLNQACQEAMADFNAKILNPYRISQSGSNTETDKTSVTASAPPSAPVIK